MTSATIRRPAAPPAPLDAKALMARGYSQHEAYGLLRRHGVKVPGGRRLRISAQLLSQIERGEVPA